MHLAIPLILKVDVKVSTMNNNSDSFENKDSQNNSGHTFWTDFAASKPLAHVVDTV
jgi:hypothetical protein